MGRDARNAQPVSRTQDFSVIIAVRDGAATIGRAIGSVLGQTHRPLEVIVVDDGSTDETPQVLSKLGSQITVLTCPPRGVSAARNAGIEASRGEWVAFLDADDVYYPERLRWHAEWIRRDARLDFLTGDFEYRLPDGELIGRSMESTPVGRALLRRSGGEKRMLMESGDLAGFVEEHFGDTHTLSVPRKTLIELGGYPTGFVVAEDTHLLIRLCAASRRVGVVGEPLAIYYLHSDSATRRDPLRSNRSAVAAMEDLRGQLPVSAREVRRGLRGRLRRSRLHLAYVLLGQGRRAAAVRAVLPNLITTPLRGPRDVVSIARGVKK